MSAEALERMLAPRTIAVIGATPTEGKAGNALMHSLASFTGTVYPVHPNAREVLGRTAYNDVRGIPEAVDLVLLAVPAAIVPGAVAACAEASVGGVVIHAGGFAESGTDGAALQRCTADAVAGTETRILGPNTSGFIVPALSLCATFVRSAANLRSGPLAIVAQSGGVNHALAFGAEQEGLGIRLAVGLGNAVDLGFADILDYLSADEQVGVIALAIEGLGDGREVTSAIERLVDRVPVVALKLGRNDVSAFAQSHTGALTGSYEVTRAALRQAGAVVVDDTTALLDAARALSARRMAPRHSPGVGIITAQAGPGLLLADTLTTEGVHAPELPLPVQERLRELLGELTFLRNPVDTGRPGPTFAEVVQTVAQSEGIDALAVYLLDEPDAIDPRAVLSDANLGPVVLGTAGPSPDLVALRDDLAQIGVAVMPTPERTAAAVAGLIRDAESAARRVQNAPVTAAPQTGDLDGTSWDESRSKDLIARLGISTPRRCVCSTADEVAAAAQTIGFPVVLKLLHPQITHKTELGAVKVGLRDHVELAEAVVTLDAIPVDSPGKYLVESMAPPGPELIIGALRDPVFGPIVMLGAGGVNAEIISDTTIRLAPLSVAEAGTMLAGLASAPLYRGHRGAEPVDEQQLAEALSALGSVLVARSDLAEIEINPLRVTSGGLVALDALVVAA